MFAFSSSLPLQSSLRPDSSLPHRNASKRRRIFPRSALPAPLAKLAATIRNLPDSKARYLHFVHLGDTLPSSPLSETAETRVAGCNSLTYVDAQIHGDKVQLEGSSDARVARGMVAFLVHGLQGCSKKEVLGCTAEEVLNASGIGGVGGRMINIGTILRHIQGMLRGNVKRTEGNGKEEVAVLLSGGVDSSVALRLAIAKGYKVRAFYLKIWLEDEMKHLGECPWEEDLYYARKVCEELDVPLEEVAFQMEYWERVVEYVLSEAKEGRTPNPDVMCNSRIKFGAFLERFGDFERIVTGHYARNGNDGGLCLSRDKVKDQTYFLGRLTREQLGKVEFPLGEFTKSEVRQMARQFALASMGRRESQGICFLGKIRFEEFLREKLGEEKGKLVEFETGREVGAHRGFWFFTTGQRRGVGLSGGPWYVVCKDVQSNVVYVSRRYEACLGGDSFTFEQPHWIGKWNGGQIRVKTRHAPTFCDASVDWGGKVWLRQRDRGLAPGQFCVFYEDEGVLGSGVISDTGLLQHAPAISGNVTKRLQAHF